MTEEDLGIVLRIERLEELAILTHGTLDVDQVKANLKKLFEKAKLPIPDLQTSEETHQSAPSAIKEEKT